MLGAYGGAVPNFVGIFRELVFINREKLKWANKIIWPVVFIVFNLLLGVCTFSSPINILPVIASTFVTISLWNRKPNITKLISQTFDEHGSLSPFFQSPPTKLHF